jgi:ElaB/YqjD/DUF883 family membrane-anchored ribosome-binding protein
MISSSNPYGSTQTTVDDAANATESGIRSTQRVTNEALDSLSDKVQNMRDQAAPLLSRVSTQAETLARQGLDAVRDSSHQLRERALQASDNTRGYIRDEPMKSVLIAAATGAALMALIGLLGRSSRSRY